MTDTLLCRNQIRLLETVAPNEYFCKEVKSGILGRIRTDMVKYPVPV